MTRREKTKNGYNRSSVITRTRIERGGRQGGRGGCSRRRRGRRRRRRKKSQFPTFYPRKLLIATRSTVCMRLLWSNAVTHDSLAHRSRRENHPSDFPGDLDNPTRLEGSLPPALSRHSLRCAGSEGSFLFALPYPALPYPALPCPALPCFSYLSSYFVSDLSAVSFRSNFTFCVNCSRYFWFNFFSSQ